MMLERLYDTPEKRARLFKWTWRISLFMLILGYLFIIIFWDG
jgi:uncharacterized membrane protein YeiB